MRTKTLSLFHDLAAKESFGAALLLFCTLLSLSLAQCCGSSWIQFWHQPLGGHSLGAWINDGLMALFFLMVGLEIERELKAGEFKKPKEALAPLGAALGGMLLPTLIYVLFNPSGPASQGWAIPMATDIAFALGLLSFIPGTPLSLKLFLCALAIADDLGAISIIAIFFNHGLNYSALALSAACWTLLWWAGKKGLRHPLPYILGGGALWFFTFQSGIHASIAGVALAFALPFDPKPEHCPSHRIQKALHAPVAWFILPLFALANTCIPLDLNHLHWDSIISGISLGLVLGKPLGILLGLYAAHFFLRAKLPHHKNFLQILGIACLGGIGFTMSLLLGNLSFQDPLLQNQAKIAVLLSSFLASLLGLGLLYLGNKKSRPEGRLS